MAEAGEIEPRPQGAVFADTQLPEYLHKSGLPLGQVLDRLRRRAAEGRQMSFEDGRGERVRGGVQRMTPLARRIDDLVRKLRSNGEELPSMRRIAELAGCSVEYVSQRLGSSYREDRRQQAGER